MAVFPPSLLTRSSGTVTLCQHLNLLDNEGGQLCVVSMLVCGGASVCVCVCVCYALKIVSMDKILRSIKIL